jgi:Flp pilus assembly protein TadD
VSRNMKPSVGRGGRCPGGALAAAVFVLLSCLPSALRAVAHSGAARSAAARPAPSSSGANPDNCEACLRAMDQAACHQVALRLAEERDFRRAIAIEDQIQARHPMDPEIDASLARMYQLGTTDSARAIMLYHAALHASSGYPPALIGLASMMESKGETELAARYYDRVVRERPNEPLFKVRLADVLLRSGREQEAEPLLREVVKRWPGSDEAGSAQRLMGRLSLARP